MSFSLKKCVEILYSGKHLEEEALIVVLRMTKECFSKMPNIVQVQSPVVVVGDIHGQFYDLMEMMKIIGKIPDINYVFLGDYVDRGFKSIEATSLLFCLKLLYPQRITMIRGNHECRSLTQVYGFYDECFKKYQNDKIWKEFCEVFDTLPLVASISETFFCVHSGLSPSIDTFDQILAYERQKEIPYEGGVCDLVWSEPDERDGWGCKPRGAGYTFGRDISLKFSWINNIDLIIRSHQICMEGYHWNHGGKVLTLFSAPNYCYSHGNLAAVGVIEKNDLECIVIQYDSSPKSHTCTEKKGNKIMPEVSLKSWILSTNFGTDVK